MDAETIHQRVAERQDEIRQRVIDALVEAQGQGADADDLNTARKAVVRAFPGIILPPKPEVESFRPPDLTARGKETDSDDDDDDDPFADISVADISGSTAEQIRERMQSVSMALNTPAGRGNAQLLDELVELQTQLNNLQ